MKFLYRFFLNTFLWLLLIPIGMQFCGVLSNQTVRWANHGTFPVYINQALKEEMETSGRLFLSNDDHLMIDQLHCVMTDQTHLNFMADVFLEGTDYVSIGDILQSYGKDLSPWILIIWGTIASYKLNKGAQHGRSSYDQNPPCC
jgi:hypothetical protein